jgi:hypothetical protein
MMTNISMFIINFVFQYVIMSVIMADRIGYITNSLGKVYLSTLMGLFMVIMHISMRAFKFVEMVPYIVLFIGVVILYKLQVGIDEKQYVNEMIEHHSMALLTSRNILEKTENKPVRELAQRILDNQKQEIGEMRNVLTHL